MRLEGLPMKNVTKIISPAKVNLVLAVGEKQESGFHEVQTIMHSLALHDTLSMRRFDDEGSGEGLQGDAEVRKLIHHRPAFDQGRGKHRLQGCG